MNKLLRKTIGVICSLSIILPMAANNIFNSSAVLNDNVLCPTGGVEESSFSTADSTVIENAFFPEISADVNAINNGTSAKGDNTYYFNKLTDTQKQSYTAFEQTVDAFTASENFSSKTYTEIDTIGVKLGTVTTGDAIKAFRAVCLDNPQYYWLSGSCSYSVQGGELNYYLQLDDFYYTPASRTEADSEISATAAQWYTQLSALSSDYDKALALHDMIVEKINYAYSSANVPESEKWAHNIHGVFSGDGAVCEGYAKTYQYMLNLLGIDNIYYIGTADGEAHAWNSVKLGENYYFVDVTWDDLNKEGAPYCIYDYFCTPRSTFTKNHTQFTSSGSPSTGKWLPTTDECANTTDYSYYHYYKSYSDGTLTTDNVQIFTDTALASGHGDYVYFIASTTTKLSYIAAQLGVPSYSYFKSVYGYLYIYTNIKINTPATAVTLDKTELTLAIDAKDTITATLTPAESDDRISWTSSDPKIAEISYKGNVATVTGKRNGTAVITATASAGKASKECTVTVGTGVADAAGYTIWVYGSTANKSITLETSLTASEYEKNGKTKRGKIVWISAEEPTDITFNTDKHTVTTRSSKKYASVTNRGKVTARSEGTAYIYACDTGSFETEEFIVDVKTAAKKIVLCDEPSNDASHIVKKSLLTVGGNDLNLYIMPTSGTSDEATYSVSLVNSTYSDRISISEIKKDGSGNMYVTLRALSTLDSGKAVKAKIQVICNESNKKCNFTATIINPIITITPTSVGGTLAKKRDNGLIQFSYALMGGNNTGGTTDKLKFVVSQDKVLAEGTKIYYSKSKLVSLKREDNLLNVTAKKDITETIYIYAVAIDNHNKEAKPFLLATIGADGVMTSGTEVQQ